MCIFFVLPASWVIGKQMAAVSKTLSGCTLMETTWEKKVKRQQINNILILKL